MPEELAMALRQCLALKWRKARAELVRLCSPHGENCYGVGGSKALYQRLVAREMPLKLLLCTGRLLGPCAFHARILPRQDGRMHSVAIPECGAHRST
jgi:hypothetical protein